MGLLKLQEDLQGEGVKSRAALQPHYQKKVLAAPKKDANAEKS